MFGVVSVISIERLPSDPLAALRELAAGEAQLDRLRREHVENAGANDDDLSDEQAMELAVAEVRAVRRSMPPV